MSDYQIRQNQLRGTKELPLEEVVIPDNYGYKQFPDWLAYFFHLHKIGEHDKATRLSRNILKSMVWGRHEKES